MRTLVTSRLTKLLYEVEPLIASGPTVEKADKAEMCIEKTNLANDALKRRDAEVEWATAKLDPEKMEDAVFKQFEYAEASATALVKLKSFQAQCVEQAPPNLSEEATRPQLELGGIRSLWSAASSRGFSE